jgi:hypothetical protein
LRIKISLQVVRVKNNTVFYPWIKKILQASKKSAKNYSGKKPE